MLADMTSVQFAEWMCVLTGRPADEAADEEAMLRAAFGRKRKKRDR